MTTFDLYAAYYDLLYRDKDYSSECQYIIDRMGSHLPSSTSILELGCGTGGHEVEFARHGHRVFGIDNSETMLERAWERRGSLSVELQDRLRFENGDVRSFRTPGMFDAVICLFHVLSYQVTNADQEATFQTARAHLAERGVLFFDFWYGPAVLSDRPKHVKKQVENDEILVDRVTTPVMHVNKNCVDVQFDVEISARANSRSEGIQESHLMRYLFLPEIKERLSRAGFEFLGAWNWLSDEALSDTSWYGCVAARAI